MSKDKRAEIVETRNFHIGDILSITTGRLVSPRHMEGIYDILNFMTGERLFTHQLPRVCREAEPVLLAQHPQLADADAGSITTENYREWLDAAIAKYGQELPVRPMTPDDHERIAPLSELAEKVHPDNIVVVRAALTSKGVKP